MREKTLLLIKPDAVKNRYIGDIITHIEHNSFHISAMKMLEMSTNQAKHFYNIHQEKPFFDDLIQFMTSGPIVALILEKINAVEDLRKLVGNTDPLKAEENTIRRKYGESVSRNAVHASDSVANALVEINTVFPDLLNQI
ncbi:MAG: nucleoside-diphosphate kinase [Candidatus Cloacimonas sp.]|nr:nucleoside-diphosphate kinase [Candidatus Cloacimonadota bacterium]